MNEKVHIRIAKRSRKEAHKKRKAERRKPGLLLCNSRLERGNSEGAEA